MSIQSDMQRKKSQKIVVTRNRRSMEMIGSLSPDFVRKLHAKPNPLFEKEPPAPALSRRYTFIQEQPREEEAVDPPAVDPEPEPESYVEELSVSNLLH